tara:strand:- start:124 stop:1305 length:1182 start_codon:yes stop_codon:yes gene_type:complete
MRVISLGNSPLANNLKESSTEDSEKYPLEVNYCPKCHNCQLSVSVPPQKMFDNYLYVSSTAKSFRKHFEDVSKEYMVEFGLNDRTLVIDIGSNDGIALKPLQKNGIPVLGVEPAVNIAKLANDSGVKTINSYFNSDTVDSIISEYGKARLVTASNIFAHSDKLVNITKDAFRVLNNDGSFVIEVQYLLNTMTDLTFDNIYHEHVNYWCVTSLNNFFNGLGFTLYKVKQIDTHGGSIRVFIKRNPGMVDSSVGKFIINEDNFGLTDFATYQSFGDKISELKDNVNKNISYLKSKYGTLVGYGSPAKATTFLNYFEVDHNDIDYIVEDNSMKHGKFIPGVNIPIRNKEYCVDNLPKIIIVMAWNFFEDIKRNNQDLIDMGVVFINIKDLQDSNFK